jgi:hypothetical protein
MVRSVPPSLISGAASRAIRTKEWQDTSMAMPKPSAELSTRRPCKSLAGAKAMAWSAMSRRPQVRATCRNTSSRSPALRT